MYLEKNVKLIIYLDETYIHTTHTMLYCWSDNSSSGLKHEYQKIKDW